MHMVLVHSTYGDQARHSTHMQYVLALENSCHHLLQRPHDQVDALYNTTSEVLQNHMWMINLA